MCQLGVIKVIFLNKIDIELIRTPKMIFFQLFYYPSQSSDKSKWLDQEQPVTNVLKLLKPYQYDNLQAHTISKLISKRNVGKNVPELIEPYDYNAPLNLIVLQNGK